MSSAAGLRPLKHHERKLLKKVEKSFTFDSKGRPNGAAPVSQMSAEQRGSLREQVERMARVRAGVDVGAYAAVRQRDHEAAQRPIALAHTEPAAARSREPPEGADGGAVEAHGGAALVLPAVPSASSTMPRRHIHQKISTPGSAANVVSR